MKSEFLMLVQTRAIIAEIKSSRVCAVRILAEAQRVNPRMIDYAIQNLEIDLDDMAIEFVDWKYGYCPKPQWLMNQPSA